MKYKFVGDGLGVAGLPHEISAEEAESYEAEYKAAAAEIKSRQKADGQGKAEDEMDLKNALSSYPWSLLQAGLKNGNYEEIKGGKAKKDEKPPKEGK